MNVFDPFLWFPIAILLNIIFSWVVIYEPVILSKNTVLSGKTNQRFLQFFIVFLSGIIVLTGIPFLESADSSRFWFVLLSIELLFFSAVTDLYYGIIPNRVLVIFIIAWVLIVFISGELELISKLIPAGTVMFIVFSINQVTHLIVKKEAFGQGDLKLLGTLALFFGWETLWIFYLSIIAGGLYSGIVAILKREELSSRVIFAPMILIGALLNALGIKIDYFYNYLQSFL